MIKLKRYISEDDLKLFIDGKIEFKILMIRSKGQESRPELKANYDLPGIPVEITILK